MNAVMVSTSVLLAMCLIQHEFVGFDGEVQRGQDGRGKVSRRHGIRVVTDLN